MPSIARYPTPLEARYASPLTPTRCGEGVSGGLPKGLQARELMLSAFGEKQTVTVDVTTVTAVVE
ncbi:hypothetical protein, partial [Streptomyces syringium]|uniref:hypothetical protein n=1 Tax=Streptomyces syringium TaxID=76729 RepID=UPI00339FA587